MTPVLRSDLTRRLHIDLQRVISAACRGPRGFARFR
jgi:hypothetical protein